MRPSVGIANACASRIQSPAPSGVLRTGDARVTQHDCFVRHSARCLPLSFGAFPDSLPADRRSSPPQRTPLTPIPPASRRLSRSEGLRIERGGRVDCRTRHGPAPAVNWSNNLDVRARFVRSTERTIRKRKAPYELKFRRRMSTQDRLRLAIIEYLQGVIKSKTLSDDATESLVNSSSIDAPLRKHITLFNL